LPEDPWTWGYIYTSKIFNTASPSYQLDPLAPPRTFLRDNEPVEKVTFKKIASSAGLKTGNYFLPSKVFTILDEMFVFP
jgi:hypothetical protein